MVETRTQKRADSKAFREALRVLAISDCTNVNCQNSWVSELIMQQLYSAYYKHTCGKYNVTCSPIGGTTCVSTGMGGPASDH